MCKWVTIITSQHLFGDSHSYLLSMKKNQLLHKCTTAKYRIVPHNDFIVLSRQFPVEYCYNVGSEFLSSLLLYSLLRAPPLRLKCKGYFCCDSKRAGWNDNKVSKIQSYQQTSKKYRAIKTRKHTCLSLFYVGFVLGFVNSCICTCVQCIAKGEDTALFLGWLSRNPRPAIKKPWM